MMKRMVTVFLVVLAQLSLSQTSFAKCPKMDMELFDALRKEKGELDKNGMKFFDIEIKCNPRLMGFVKNFKLTEELVPGLGDLPNARRCYYDIDGEQFFGTYTDYVQEFS